MKQNVMEEIELKKRQQYLHLTDFLEITEQLAQALERKDEVSVKLLLSMRQEPSVQLWELETAIEAQIMAQPEQQAIHLKALLQAEHGQTATEEALCRQSAQNRRLLQKAAELDRWVSLQLGGKRSLYAKYR